MDKELSIVVSKDGEQIKKVTTNAAAIITPDNIGLLIIDITTHDAIILAAALSRAYDIVFDIIKGARKSDDVTDEDILNFIRSAKMRIPNVGGL